MNRFGFSKRALVLATLVAVPVVPIAVGVAHASTTTTSHIAAPTTAVARQVGKTSKGGTTGHAKATSKSFVTTAADVAERTKPTLAGSARKVGTVAKAGTRVTVACYVTGQSVHGDTVWYRTT